MGTYWEHIHPTSSLAQGKEDRVDRMVDNISQQDLSIYNEHDLTLENMGTSAYGIGVEWGICC